MKNIIEVLERARTWIEVQPVPRIDGAGSLVVELGKVIEQLAAAGKPIDAIAPMVEPQETASGAGFESPLASPVDPRLFRRGDYVRKLDTDEICLVWGSSFDGTALIRFSCGSFERYSGEEMAKIFSLEPKLTDDVKGWWNPIDDTVRSIDQEYTKDCFPLYARQQKCGWVGLSDADIKDAMLNLCDQSAKSAIVSLMHQSSKETVTDFRLAIDGIARAIEVKLKEKNK